MVAATSSGDAGDDRGQAGDRLGRGRRDVRDLHTNPDRDWRHERIEHPQLREIPAARPRRRDRPGSGDDRQHSIAQGGSSRAGTQIAPPMEADMSLASLAEPVRGSIGLIIPSANRLTEPQLNLLAPPGFRFYVTRLRFVGEHERSLGEILSDAAEAAELLVDAGA